MNICCVRFTSWDQLYYFQIPEGQEYQIGDWVVAKTPTGSDLGRVESFFDGKAEELAKEGEITQLLRRADRKDLDDLEANNSHKKDFLKFCRELVKKQKLGMKLVDAHASLDNNKITYAFIADGRIDFRELVKELVKKYNKIIRLQQLGVRDEVKYFGDMGSCGRGLCCQGSLSELGNVTSDYAKNQQVANRGAERLSGVCGRLKCCLAYEEKAYEDLNKSLPALGTRIKSKEGDGTVVGYHTLKGTVDLEVSNGEGTKVVEVKV